jgi:hypothetical protein
MLSTSTQFRRDALMRNLCRIKLLDDRVRASELYDDLSKQLAALDAEANRGAAVHAWLRAMPRRLLNAVRGR